LQQGSRPLHRDLKNLSPRQIVRDLNGVVLGNNRVGHRFTVKDGLIKAMEVCPL
jgi:hypothetical protein